MGSQTDQGLTEPVYTLDDIAAALRLSTMTLYRRVKEGELKAFRVGRGWRVTKSERDAYFARLGFTADAATA